MEFHFIFQCHREDYTKPVNLIFPCFPTQDANASTKLLHANPTVMKIKEYIDLISKLLINFTAEQKYCIAQLKQILTSLPPAMSPRTNEGQNGNVYTVHVWGSSAFLENKHTSCTEKKKKKVLQYSNE